MKLHLGCGKRNFGKGWIHIDGDGGFSHLHSHNITKLPFDGESADLIYASHVIEYFDRHHLIPLLQEWHRVLKVGGIIRLAVPDFAAMVKLYLDGEDLSKFLGPLYGRMAQGATWIYHKTVFDEKHLTNILIQAGFVDIRGWDWRKVDHGKFDDHSQAYLPHLNKDTGVLISLNIEATK